MMEPEADEVVVVDKDKPAVVAAANDIGICTGEEDSWVPTEERVDGADADAVAFFISLLMFPLGFEFEQRIVKFDQKWSNSFQLVTF